MNPDNEFAYKAEAVRCHACATRDRAARKVDAAFDESGIRWIVTKKERPT